MDGVRLIYNNDGENLWAVDSAGAKLPYHPKTGSGIDAATIRGSALDVADIADVDMICPFHVRAAPLFATFSSAWLARLSGLG